MCTYEDLVDATLPHGLLPLVVPHRRRTTLGAAVAGLAVGPTSFRNGLPHESVLEMDVLTGAGAVVTTRPGDDLFDAFPRSHGCLGYATRLRIELEQVPPYVDLRRLRFDDAGVLAKTVTELVETHEHDGSRVDGLEGVTFGPQEHYLTLSTWRSEAGPISDLSGQGAYARSTRSRDRVLLSTREHLWRWDHDGSWWHGRRTAVQQRLARLDERFGLVDRLDRRAGRPPRERGELEAAVPVERLGDLLAEVLAWDDVSAGEQPVRLTPVVARRAWPAHPLASGATYVSVAFRATAGGPGRALEERVRGLGGHPASGDDVDLTAVRRRYDPDGRLTGFPLRPTW